MKLTYKRKLALLMAFQLLWGLVLWASISKYGMGVSTDSVHYMFTGLNLSRGLGFVSFDSSHFSLWPPLYPLLIAGVRLATGLDPYISATALQVAAFVLLALCLSVLFLRLFPEDFILAFAGCFMSQMGPVVVSTFQLVGSDYIHVLFVLTFVLLAGSYLRGQKLGTLLLMFLVAALAMLQRYPGAAAILTGTLLVFVYTTGKLRKRLARSLVMAASSVPAGIWMLSQAASRRPPIPISEHIVYFSNSILSWWFERSWVEGHPLSTLALWLIVSGMIVYLVWSARRFKGASAEVISILSYGLIYVLILFGASLFVYFNKLGDRFLLPVYIPVIVLILSVVGAQLRRVRQAGSTWRWRSAVLVSGLFLLGLNMLLFLNTGQILIESFRYGAIPGNSYNTESWNENKTLRYWEQHQPAGDFAVYSNYPAGIAFHTWHSSYPTPYKYASLYSDQVIPLSHYESMFPSGMRIFLVWIEPNSNVHMYSGDELRPIAEVVPLFVGQDGDVYQLLPKE